MTLLRLTTLLLLGSLLSLGAETRDAETLFFEANILAAEESFAEAIPLYQAALAQRPSANLHYNLANALYRTGDWGRARLHWERTLAMAPRHPEARHNLQLLLQEQGLDPLASGPGAAFSSFLPLNRWIGLVVVSFWVMVGGMAAGRWKKKISYVMVAALGGVGVLTSAFALFFGSPGFHDAILLDEQVSLRVAPTSTSPVISTLGPGQQTRIVDTHGTFYRVRLPNSQEGFIQANELERIRSPAVNK
jgi:hypothetical protein